MNTALLHLENNLEAGSLTLASHELLTNMSSEDVRNYLQAVCNWEGPRFSSSPRGMFPRERAFSLVLRYGS